MKHTKDLTVVYIITKLELGGAQKVCLSLFEGLEKEGVHTQLMSGSSGTLVDQVKNKPNVILLDSFKHAVSLKSMWLETKNFINLIRTLRTLKKEHPHIIVHTHSTKAGIIGRWAAFFAGIKKRVHTIHGYAFHAHQKKHIWLLIYLAEWITSLITTHFVCVSSADVKTGVRLFPRFAHKHSIIRAAVDWDTFYTPAIPAPNEQHDPFVFGTVACFKPQKNLFDLLHAFKQVHTINPHTRLEIIGDGIQRPALEQWIAHHNLQSVITLHGWQHNVAPFMRTWHAFVLSSLWEGLPCAIVEARLTHLPVISYNTGGIHDVITHGSNGFLIAQKNVAELAEQMNLVATNTAIYQHMRAHEDQLHDFKTTSMIREHAKLYRKI